MPVRWNEPEAAANSRADMGRVMAEIKTRAAGKVDMAQVSALVRYRLGER